ncbi:MAG: hypothetical protein ABIO05_06940 [Ferruginibacter sp.]
MNHFSRAAILVCVVTVISIFCWEQYLRNKGYKISYDDGAAMWSAQRDKVYDNTRTTFIGSSRIKYDLDIDTWNELTGDKAVQLAMQGTSPLPILHNLAEDNRFKGRLILDVTEGLFFAKSPGRQHEVTENLNFYKNNHTPAQRAGFALNNKLENQFVFLDKDYFSLAALLNKIPLPPRKGVFGPPDFPLQFNQVTSERQSFMTPDFATDSNLSNQVIKIWQMMGSRPQPPPTGDTLERILNSVKRDIDKIKSRGGKVVLVRTPSSGSYLMKENMGFPRNAYWTKLVALNNGLGFHFLDDSITKKLLCPELSHLTRQDAIVYTKALINHLELLGWAFPNKKEI